MRFQILNNEELGFYDNNGDKKAILKLSGSDFILDPVDTGANIIMGNGETVNDLELGIASTPINMTFLGGGTISSNAGTLYIGDGVNSDRVVLQGVTISSSVDFAAGLTGSFQGSFTGDGSNITGITATTAPGGNNKTIQFNDNNTATGGNNNFTFDKTTNTVELTGSINVSGSSSANYFFGDGSGLTNIVGAFPFTGSAGVSGSIVVEGPVTASGFSGDGSGLTNVAGVFPFTGSAGVSGSIVVEGPVTASGFSGDGSGLTNVAGVFPFTGSAGVSGSLEVNGDTTITGSLDINGNITATEFSGNGANLTGVTSTFAPTGQDKSLQFNKGGTEISGSGGLLFDYDNDSLYVAQAVTASEFIGHGSLNTPFIGNTETTGSVKITGSLNIDGDPIITGSLFIEKNSNTVAIGKGVVDGGYNHSTLVGQGARAFGEHSIAIGRNAGAKSYMTTLGWYAASSGGGGFSVAIGSTSHRFNTGGQNVAVGSNTLLNGNGGYNVAVGQMAMENGSSNTYNTSLGYYSGRNMVGHNNVIIGNSTGQFLTGSKNVLLGYQAGYNLTGSNQLIIANNSSSALISGDFDTGAVEFLGNSFKVGTNRPAGPVFEVGDGPISSYTTDLILRPRGNSAYNFHYWGIIRWDPSGTNRGLRLLSGDYTNSVQIGTGLSGSSSETIIANFTNTGVRIGDRSSPNADLDVNGTALVSGSLIAKEVSGGPTDIFQVQDTNGSTLFEVRPGFVQFGNLGDSLGVDFSGGNRYLKFFNTAISAQGHTGITATGNINFSPGSGTNNKVGLLGGSSAYGHVSLAQGSATAFSYPNNMATELIFRRSVNHLAYHAVIRGDDNQYQPVPIYIFGGKHTTNGTYKPVVLQHDTSESRGNVGIGLEDPNYTLDIQSGTNTTLRLGSTTTNQGEHKIGFGFHNGDTAMGVAIIGKAIGASGKGSLSFAAHSGGDNASASYADRVLEIQNDQAIFKKTVNAENDVFTIGGSNTGDVGLFLHKETRTAIVSKLLGGSNISDLRLVTGIPKNGGITSASLDQYARLTITQDGNTEISGSLTVDGSVAGTLNIANKNGLVVGSSNANANGVNGVFEFLTGEVGTYDSTLLIRKAGNPGGFGLNNGLYLRTWDGGGEPDNSSIGTANYDRFFFKTGMTPTGFGTIRGGYTSTGNWFFGTGSAATEGFYVHNTAKFNSNLTVGNDLSVNGDQIDFTNLPTSDPGVAGLLFQTGSAAIGATAGTQIVCISQG